MKPYGLRSTEYYLRGSESLSGLAFFTLISTNFKPIFYFSLETIIKSIAVGWISSLCSITWSLDELQ